MRPLTRSRSGITLVEITVTITVIFILMAAVFLAIDPLKRTAQARNSRRAGDAEAIAKAAAVRLVRAEPLSVDEDPMTWQMLGTATEGCNVLCGPSYSLHMNEDLSGSESNFVEVPKEVFTFAETGKFSLSAWVVQTQQGRPFYSIFTNELPPFLPLPRRGLTLSWFNGPVLFMYEDLINQGDTDPSAWNINPLDKRIAWYTEEDLDISQINAIGAVRHITVTYDGTNPADPDVWLYVNGERYTATKQTTCAPEGSCTLPSSINIQGNENYAIGNGLIGNSLVAAPPIGGLVDDFRIYDGILTDDEAKKIYEGEKFTPQNAQMVTRFTFNEPPGYNEGMAKNEVGDGAYDGIYRFDGTANTPLPGRVSSFSVPGGAETLPACLNAAELVQAGYLPAIPFDPKIDQSLGINGYAVNRVGGSVVTRACFAEGEGPRATGDPKFIEVAH